MNLIEVESSLIYSSFLEINETFQYDNAINFKKKYFNPQTNTEIILLEDAQVIPLAKLQFMYYLESLKDVSNESFFNIFRKRPRLESGLIIKHLGKEYLYIALDNLYERDLLIEYTSLFNNTFHYTELVGIVFDKETKKFYSVSKNQSIEDINTIFESVEIKPNIDFLYCFDMETPLLIGGGDNHDNS